MAGAAGEDFQVKKIAPELKSQREVGIIGRQNGLKEGTGAINHFLCVE